MNINIDFELLLKHIRNECTLKENDYIKDWLEADPENRNLYDILRRSYDDLKTEAELIDVEKAWNKVAAGAGLQVEPEAKAEKTVLQMPAGRKSAAKSSFMTFSNILRYAAVFIAVLTIPLMIFKFYADEDPEIILPDFNEVIVDNGTQTKITLPDGSRVTLDAGSRFTYPAEFGGDSREVNLDGEGYFEVQPDKNKPFIVNAGEAVIRVLGTKFNIRAWSGEEYEKVIVTEGRVSLKSDSDPVAMVIIEKDQMSIIQNGRPTMPVMVDAAKSTAWLRYEMDFDDVKLSEIFDQLERWYSVEINVDDQDLLSMRLKLYLPNRPLNSILDLISSLIGLEYEKDGNNVRFKRG
ncbi:MAG: DUF4974 domain-containing protein [bacterium]|nr:DUF4974 domain-containing protein [bacterium]